MRNFKPSAFFVLHLAVCILHFALAAPLRAETLTLAECLRETAAHNPAIIQQRYAIAHAGADRLVLRARALPLFLLGGLAGQLQQEDVGTRSTVKNPATGKVTTVITATTDRTTLIALGNGNALPAAF